MKEVKIIMYVVVNMALNLTKTIREKVVSIHQTMKE